MVDFIVAVIVLAIIGASVVYIIREKKKGVKCIGCPAGAQCGKNSMDGLGCGGSCSGNCGGCNCHSDMK